MSSDFLKDPLWYKDAVIYELHVRSFFDGNDDGYGDFAGLRKKMPYLESLGINTLWLLPFLESPLKDDGYDTADYFKILPVHGTAEDFKDFLDEAHSRGIRVITELVLNHTSDQHPWFVEARDPQSPKHDWYVWSDTPEKYKEARIIFTDTEHSNWTWDRKAHKYYWHRFFSHQPDLNYDNPEVRKAMREAMFYWLDLGVDGLRLDAVPYLYEREGTNCENLPETIEYIAALRQSIEERYGPGRILLAEANQWPEDTLPYFAGGNGVQMAFNFPIMPRMYMALRRENRRPLVEMLQLTQDIPDEAQWAIFLRNHDELTLEMVTDEERDYMYHEYATDARFRINVGIRRRLAPLLGGERRRIELMTALLLSLKGSPILYYGDEIGMGDDPFLGDRNGVRTPMQWSPDKNGGFSRAPHHRLFMPAIVNGPYSYNFVNVEDAQNDPYSLLNFMKRLLALRGQHVQVFGRGSFEVIPVENQAVLVFLREYEGEKILVVANLSRFAQSLYLPPSAHYRGLVPVELFSKAAFPVLGEDPYHLPLGPHGFYWFALQPVESLRHDGQLARQQSAKAAAPAPDELSVIEVTEGVQNVLVKTMVQNQGLEQLEALLPAYLKKQRWFGSKGEAIERVHLEDAVRLQAAPVPFYLSILSVSLPGRTESYLLPLSVVPEDEAASIQQDRPQAALAWLQTPSGRGLLHDATASPAFWLALYRWWRAGSKSRSLMGLYVAHPSGGLPGDPVTEAKVLSGEQSNSAAILGGQYFVKLYRRLERGVNPEMELLGSLTESGFKFIPQLYGTMTHRRADQQYALGIVQEALPIDSDGWEYALTVVGRFLDRVSQTTLPQHDGPSTYTDTIPAWLEDVAPEMLSLARVLGIRTAEMHLALSHAEDPDVRPLPGETEDTTRLVERVRAEAEQTRKMLAAHADTLENVPDDAAWKSVSRFLDLLGQQETTRQQIRIHGDYHLGQVMRADGEFYILDFEGEPARSLEERRKRDYALRDVAGMLRSMEYVALAAWREYAEDPAPMLAWTNALVQWCEAVFLQAYFGTAEQADFLLPRQMREPFLWAFLLDKALYEVRYELNHRPDWTWLPLEGLKRLLDEARRQEEKGSLFAQDAS